VCYVNSSVAVKAASDICCTSSNAVRVVASIPREHDVLFVPDKNLGGYVAEQCGRELILYPGYCPIHHAFNPGNAQELREQHPGALLLAHPECTRELRTLADYVGSTTGIIEYCKNSPHTSFIIATEKGVLHPLAKARPDASFIPLSAEGGVCPDMKRTTLEDIAGALENNTGEVYLPRELIAPARASLERMLACG
jgi:quinolinate synthase